MFELGLALQLGLFFLSAAVMHGGRRYLGLFGPSLIFVYLHLFFYYLLPQAAMLLDGDPGYALQQASSRQVLQAQTYVLTFILLFVVSRLLTNYIKGPVTPARQQRLILAVDPLEKASILALSVLGMTCLFAFATTLSGVVYRSEAVKGLSGQLLLAGSYLCHFFLVLLSLSWWSSGRKLASILAIVACAGLFLYLGGRSRAILVIIYFAWLLLLYRIRISLPSILLIFGAIVAILPVWSLLKDLSLGLRTGSPNYSAPQWEGLAERLVSGNTASTFRSLAQVMDHAGAAPPTGTPGSWYMQHFYSEVYAKGVGFHLGMIGEAYLLGGALAIVGLAVALGVSSSLVDRVFVTSERAGTKLMCLILSTWLFAIGWNLISSLFKISAAMFGPLAWWAVMWALRPKDKGGAVGGSGKALAEEA